MRKTIKNLVSLFLIFNLIVLPSFADDMYKFDDKPMTQVEVNIWKYKMERITVRYELGKWEIIQGINSKLTDIQLLKLINSENIATDRLKATEFKQNFGSGIALVGIVLTVIGGLFVGNVIKFDNSLYYGIGGIAGGLSLALIGNSISPIVSDEESHIITLDEARFAADTYNKELIKILNIPLKEQ